MTSATPTRPAARICIEVKPTTRNLGVRDSSLLHSSAYSSLAPLSFQDDPPFLSWRWEAEPTFSATRNEVGFRHGLNDLLLLVDTAVRAQMAGYL